MWGAEKDVQTLWPVAITAEKKLLAFKSKFHSFVNFILEIVIFF